MSAVAPQTRARARARRHSSPTKANLTQRARARPRARTRPRLCILLLWLRHDARHDARHDKHARRRREHHRNVALDCVCSLIDGIRSDRSSLCSTCRCVPVRADTSERAGYEDHGSSGPPANTLNTLIEHRMQDGQQRHVQDARILGLQTHGCEISKTLASCAYGSCRARTARLAGMQTQQTRPTSVVHARRARLTPPS